MLKTESFDEEYKTELRRKEKTRIHIPTTYQKHRTSNNSDFYNKKRQSLSNLVNVKKREHARPRFEFLDNAKKRWNLMSSIRWKQNNFTSVIALQNSYQK